MAKIPVTTCSAGPALDAAVQKLLRDDMTGCSVDIDVAWDLVDKAHLSIWCAGGFDNWVWGAGYWREGDLLCWSHDLTPEDCLSPMCETAPLAITRAFLLAHGVSEVEVPDD